MRCKGAHEFLLSFSVLGNDRYYKELPILPKTLVLILVTITAVFLAA